MAECEVLIFLRLTTRKGDSPSLSGEQHAIMRWFRRIENTWMQSFLSAFNHVDEVYGLGVCQGGSIMASSAGLTTDTRWHLVSGMMAVDAFQWTG